MAVNKLQKKWSGKILDLCAFSTGFIAVVFLLMLTRESMAYYGGQDVLLGLIPAFCFGGLAYGIRYIKKHIQKDTLSLLIVSYLAGIPALLFSVIITRSLPVIVQQPAGSDVPFYWMLAGAILAVIPLNIVLGTQISLLNHLYIGKNKKEYPAKTSQAFKWILTGGLTGALLYIVFGAYLLTSFNVISFLTLLVWCCLAALVGILIPAEDPMHRKFWGTVALIALFLFILLLFSPVSGSLEKWTQKKVWQHTQLMRTFNTSHGKLSFTLTEHELTAYCNRTRIYTTSENARIEENAHIPALAVPVPPRNILMIGGGLGGTLEELLKHSSLETIDYCEFDKKLLSHSRDYLLQFNYFRDKRVQLRAGDGRSFLRKTKEHYDLILVNAAPVGTLMTARFTTDEFFAEAREKLSTTGIMVLTLPATYTASGDIRPAGIRSMTGTFKKQFPNAVIIPAQDLYCIGSAVSTDRFEALDGYVLSCRMAERGIHTASLTAETLPVLLPAGKIIAAQGSFDMTADNRDTLPSAYGATFYSWACPYVPELPGLFTKGIGPLIYTAILVLLCIIVIRNLKRTGADKAALFYGLHGAVLSGMTTALLFIFQLLTGMAYIGAPVISAALLAGMLYGHMMTEKNKPTNKNTRNLLPTLTLLCMFTAAICGMLTVRALPVLPSWTYMFIVPMLAACAGYPLGRSASAYMSGYAAQTRTAEPGLLVSDHYRATFCGAVIASLLMSLMFIPVLGSPGSLLLICAGVLALTLIAYS